MTVVSAINAMGTIYLLFQNLVFAIIPQSIEFSF